MEFKRYKMTMEEKAQRILEELDKYYEKYPDKQSGPKVTITQDWEVLLDYEGEPCSSDYEDYVTLYINHYEDEEWRYSLDTIKRVIPLVDEYLDDAISACLRYLGEIPTHKNNISKDVYYFMSFISSSIYQVWKNSKNSDWLVPIYEIDPTEEEWLIEIDMSDSCVYPLSKKFCKPNNGEQFIHLEIEPLLITSEEGNKEINFKKVKAIAEKLVEVPMKKYKILKKEEPPLYF